MVEPLGPDTRPVATAEDSVNAFKGLDWGVYNKSFFTRVPRPSFIPPNSGVSVSPILQTALYW